MHAYFTRTPFQTAFVLAIAVITAMWWLTVPDVIAASTFVALAAVIAASVWVVITTWENARPASSLAQSLHDERVVAVERTRQRAGKN